MSLLYKVIVLFAIQAFLGMPLAAKIIQKDHYGPLGLKWGKSPAEARSILANKLEFIEEIPAEEAPYHTIDQVYSGNFGKLLTDKIFLRFYKGEFFYLAAYMNVDRAGTVSGVFHEVVSLVKELYGAPMKESRPPQVTSNYSIHDNLPWTENKDATLQLLWNESRRVSEMNLWKLHDIHILTDMWRPIAEWRFKNGILIQTFVHRDTFSDGTKGVPKLYWIFAWEDVFRAWRNEVHVSKIIEPQDF